MLFNLAAVRSILPSTSNTNSRSLQAKLVHTKMVLQSGLRKAKTSLRSGMLISRAPGLTRQGTCL